MPETERWTVGRLLEWTTTYLSSHGAQTPRLDAELLLAEARQCERIELYTSFDECVDAEVRTAFRELVRRRAEGVPVAYLLGRREFYSLDFFVTPDVLVPRPESEFVIVRLCDLAKQYGLQTQTLRIVDVGTGSGNLAVCAAHELKQATVWAIDISRQALQVAKKNIARHDLQQRVMPVVADLLSAVVEEPMLDFVISNPPYVRSDEMANLPRDVIEHEPHLALEAGPRGTEVIEKLIAQSLPRLRVGGFLIVEVSPMIHNDVIRLLEADRHFERLPTTKDLAGLPRVVAARKQA